MKAGAPRIGLRLIARPREVEASLWRRLRFENDDACRELLFNRQLDLARAIAIHEYRRRPAYGLDRKDFEQFAYSGLLEAIDRFNPLHGAPFDAFARRRIRGAITDGLAKSSESGAQYAHRRRVELERLRSLGTAAPQADPIVDLSDLAIGLALGLVIESARFSDLHAAPGELGAYESVSWRDLQVNLLKAIERLPEAEKSVMQQHYLNGVSFVQIARLLNVTKGRVSQIHSVALRRVRERLRSLG